MTNRQNELLTALASMVKNYVNKDGLLYFKNKIDTIYAKKTEVPTKTSQLTNDSTYQTATQITDALKPYAKTVDVPTKTSQIANDSGFQTGSEVENAITSKGYQTQAQVQAMVNNAQHMKREVVSVLPQPTSANELTIYLVPNASGSYDEYMLINGQMDKVGGTEVNLQGYYNEDNLQPVTNAEIDKIFI